MKVSIGVLAYNEESMIQKTLESLFQQTLFSHHNPDLSIELIIVPNGCTDATALTADSAVKALSDAAKMQVSWRVCELSIAGKSNAWNIYVHDLSDPHADYLFLMDADIEILDENTLASMVSTLENISEAWISVDKPIKDVTLKSDKTLMEHLSVLISGLSGGKSIEEEPAWICGQLYCARAEKLRQIWLPTQLPAQDSFLYTMITTDGLRTSMTPSRVILARSASHKFEAYTKVSRLLRHEKWLIIASAVNEIVYDLLRASRDLEEHVGLHIQQLNQKNPEWLNHHVREGMLTKGAWIIPGFILVRRFKSLRHKLFIKAAILFPIATCAFLVDLWLAIQANYELKKGSKLGYWGK